jgi:hypothetical protein
MIEDGLVTTYVVSRDAFDRLRRQANSERRHGFEVGGKFLAERDRLINYQPLRNLSTEPGWFEVAQVPLAPFIVVHTHPMRYHAGVSPGDVSWMKHFVRPLGVYEPSTDRLTIWKLRPGRESGVAPVPVVVEPRPRGRARPPLRPGRR